MANEFIVRKGLVVEGASSGTVVNVLGSLGQLFSVTDNLTGSIFAVSDISGIPILDVNSSGKIGIGTTSPATRLTISGVQELLQLTRGGASDTKWFFSADSQKLYIAEDTSATSNIKMTLTDAGKVGIGTISPDKDLTVGGINPTHGINLRTKSGSSEWLLWSVEQYFSQEGFMRLFYDNVSKIQFRANSDSFIAGGKLGIGMTTTPGRMLEVNGGSTNDGGIKLTCSANLPNFWSGIEFRSSVATSFIYMSSDDADGTLKFLPDSSLKGSLSKAGTWTVAADVVAYGSPSDKRLKENIKPIDSALDKVMKLKGVTFDWIQKEDQILNIKEDIGFIAQDVQKVVPELVRENEDGMLSMRHQGVAPILIEAIKELKAEIEDLKKKIK